MSELTNLCARRLTQLDATLSMIWKLASWVDNPQLSRFLPLSICSFSESVENIPAISVSDVRRDGAGWLVI